jgi:predicted alpha/beta superfamily hydrolase
MKKVCFLLGLLFIPSIIIAQLSDTTFIQHTFCSAEFGKERKITVQLPSQYFDYPSDSFMVTYLLDAQGPHYFNMQVGNLDYLSSRYGIIPTILVGIHTVNRFQEFTPQQNPSTEKMSNFTSELEQLQNHLEKEVMPWIKSNYRTKPFKAIIGHSKAAHFVLHTLFGGKEDLFDAYLAISPAIGFDDHQLIEVAEKKLREIKDLHKFLYVSSGNVGSSEQYFDQSVEMLDFLLSEKSLPSFDYYREKFEGKDHFTTVAPAVVSGMVHLKNKHMLSQENVEKMNHGKHDLTWHMDRFLNQLERNGDYAYQPPLTYYTRMASNYFDEEEYAHAAGLYQWAEEKGRSLRWWELFNTGTSLCKMGQKEKGNKYYDQAFEKIKLRKEEYAENYNQIIADLERQRAENQN